MCESSKGRKLAVPLLLSSYLGFQKISKLTRKQIYIARKLNKFCKCSQFVKFANVKMHRDHDTGCVFLNRYFTLGSVYVDTQSLGHYISKNCIVWRVFRPILHVVQINLRTMPCKVQFCESFCRCSSKSHILHMKHIKACPRFLSSQVCGTMSDLQTKKLVTVSKFDMWPLYAIFLPSHVG